MSDAYYEEQARQRTRRLIIVGAAVVVVACVVIGIVSLFRDACTRSFDRSPEAVVSAFVEAVGRGDLPVTQECWEHETYYDLEAGCSEICLSKVLGAPYELIDVSVGEPYTTPDSRANLEATVSVACVKGGETHTGEIVLDSVAGNVPWRHWAIVSSTFGGTVAEPWCQ